MNIKAFKIAAFVAILVCIAPAYAQNIQLHYDLGRHIYSDDEPERQYVTASLEQFKADRLGSWYYFVDLDLRSHGMTGAYTEISREFTLKKDKPWAAHIEYDGGLNCGGSFQHAALLGPAYNWHNADFSRTWSLQALYKQYFAGNDLDALSSFQLTTVWAITFYKSKFTFSGFADLWYGYRPRWAASGRQCKGLVFISEPQFWYNIIPKLSVGTEWELSNNFVYPASTHRKFFFNPTIALKVNL